MSHIRVLICRVDDPASNQMTELAAFDLPTTDTSTLQPQTIPDELEMTTHATGNAILRHALQAQWDIIDTELTEQHRRAFSPSVGSGTSREQERGQTGRVDRLSAGAPRVDPELSAMAHRAALRWQRACGESQRSDRCAAAEGARNAMELGDE